MASSPCELLPSGSQLTCIASFISFYLLRVHPDANHLQQAKPDPGLQASSFLLCLLLVHCNLDTNPMVPVMRCLPHMGCEAFLSLACVSVPGSSSLHITSIINVVAFSIRTYQVKAWLILGVVTQALIVPQRPMTYRPSLL